MKDLTKKLYKAGLLRGTDAEELPKAKERLAIMRADRFGISVEEAKIQLEEEAKFLISTGNCCPKCGGTLLGDGYTTVVHCEYVKDIGDVEPDASPIYCDFEEEKC